MIRPLRLHELALLGLAAVASIATSSPQAPMRGYPMWRVDKPRVDAGCTNLVVDVVKSGKEGVGVMLLRESPECDVRVERARLHIGDVTEEPVALGDWDRRGTIYLGFAFDNERLWNDGTRLGVLVLDVVSGDQRRRLVLSMYHAWDGWHPPRGAPPAPIPAAAPVMPVAVPPAGSEER